MLTLAAPTSPALIAMALDASVKALIAAAVAAAIARLLRRASARVRYRVWLGALLVMVLALCLAPVYAANEGARTAPVILPDGVLPPSIWTLLAVVWAFGALTHAARTVAGLTALALDRRRLPIARERAWHRHVEHARVTLGLRANVRVLYGRTDTVPMCWGLFGGTIAVPAASARWSNRLRRAVVLHECAHLRRRDPLVMLAEQIVSALLWFNPAVWFVVGHLRRERELACDEVVVEAGVRSDAYARLLVTLARRCRPTFAPAHAIVRPCDMQDRVAALLASDTACVPSRHHRVVLAIGVMFAVLTVTRVVAIASPADVASGAAARAYTAQPGESPASFRAGLFGSDR